MRFVAAALGLLMIPVAGLLAIAYISDLQETGVALGGDIGSFFGELTGVFAVLLVIIFAVGIASILAAIWRRAR